MVARLASIAQRYQKVAGSSPAVVIFAVNSEVKVYTVHCAVYTVYGGLGARVCCFLFSRRSSYRGSVAVDARHGERERT